MDIVFDIGGSRMRFARVLGAHNLSEPVIVKTPETYLESITKIDEIVRELGQGESIRSCVGGIAGVFNKEGTELLLSPNLKEWEKKPLHADLKRVSGAQKVIIRNDTDMTGLGEAVFGAGCDAEIVAYLTFSTGIGGSLIVGQDVAPYHFGFEPGFQIIEDTTLRQLHDVSGTALKEKYGGKLFKDITGIATRQKIMRSVITGIHNTIVFWSPDVVVLGGGMTESFVLEDIQKELEEIPLRFPELPDIVFAEMQDTNGLYGALAYRNKHIA